MADAGRIVIIPKGEYKSNITYERLDAVEYNSNGYIALKTVTGITPTNDGTNWALYVKGTQVDSELSETSTNAIQNKIVTAEISALKKEGLEELYKKMAEIFRIEKINTENTSIITNIRHKDAIVSAKNSILKTKETIEQGMPIDITAIYFKEAIEELNKITGENVTEDIINEIFSKFCLGK